MRIQQVSSVISKKSLGAFFAVLALLVQPIVQLNIPSVLAASENITSAVFEANDASVEANTNSTIFSVRLKNAINGDEVVSAKANLTVTSTSTTGRFASNVSYAYGSSNTSTFTINSGTSLRSFYYRDTTPGIYTIRAEASGGDMSSPKVIETTVEVVAPTDTQAPSMPTTSVAQGTYPTAQSITLNAIDNSGAATIHYTTDGSTPTLSNGVVYSAPIMISTTTTLKAIAYDAANNLSPVLSATYTITPVIVEPTPTVSVTRSTATNGWVSNGTVDGGSINYVTDANSPSGSGALQLSTSSSTGSKAVYSKSQVVNLSALQTMSYSTKQRSASFVAGLPSYQLGVCLNGVSGGCQGFTSLVYEPYISEGNQAVQSDTWQTWKVSEGVFYSTRAVGSLVASQGSSVYTLAQLKSEFPNAVVYEIRINVGSNNPSYDTLVDTVRFDSVIYDFEPAQALVAPTDLTPASNSATNNQNFAMTWKSVLGAASYEYETSASLTQDGSLGPIFYSDSSTTQAYRYTEANGSVKRDNFATPAGTYYWHVRAIGVDGTPGPWSSISKVSVDYTKPSVSLKTSSVGSISTRVLSEADFKLSDNTAVAAYIVNGTRVGVTPNAFSDANDIKVGTLGGVYGTANTIQVEDTAGNLSEPFSFTLDNVLPTATVKSSTLGTDGYYRSVNYQLYDAYKIDKITLNDVVKDLSDNMYSDLNGVTPGQFGAREGQNTLVVYDVAGNKRTYNFVLDTTKPTGTFSYDLSNDVVKKGPVTVTLTAIEPVVTPAGWDRVNDTTFTKVFTENAQGSVVLTDIAGNVSDPLSYEVKNIDNVKPTIEIDQNIKRTSDGRYIITGTVSETNTTVEVTVGNGVVQSATVDGLSWSFITSVLPDGIYQITATSRDAAGNTSSVQQRTFTATAPFTGGDAVSTTPASATLPLATFAITPTGNQTGASTGIDNGAALGAATTPSDEDNNGDVLGTKDQKNSNVIAAVAPSDQGWKLWGVAWYWWLIPLLLAVAIWRYVVYRRNKTAE